MKQTPQNTRFKLKPLVFGCLAASLLVGCQTTHQKALEKPDMLPESSTIEHIDEPTWVVDDCKVKAEVERTLMQTDGNVSHNTIRMTVQLPEPSQTFLSASLYGVGGFSMNVVGRKANWALELPNTPYAAAQMIRGKTYLFLAYTPEATSYAPAPLEKVIVFPLKELPQALAELEATCK